MPAWSSSNLKRRPLFWHFPHYANQGGEPGCSVRRGDWKLIEWYEDGRLELFNLKEDLGEKNDLSTKHPDRVKALHEKLKKWRQETGAKMSTKNPRYKG